MKAPQKNILTPILPIPLRPEKPTRHKLLQSLGLAFALTLIPAKEMSAQEQQLSPEERVIVESVFGADVVAQWEAAGFTFSVPVEADEHGSYIIHVGQIHTNTFEGIGRLFTNNIVSDFQSQLYDLLPTITQTGSNVVFAEGFASDMSTSLEAVRSLRVQLESWQTNDIATLEEAQALMELLKIYSENRRHPFVMVHIPSTLISPLVETISSFIHSYVSENEEERLHLKILDFNLSALALRGVTNLMVGNPQDSDALNSDALAKLYFDDKIYLAPAESLEANQRVIEAVGAERDANRAFEIGRMEFVMQDSQLEAWMDELKPLFEKEQAGTLSPDEKTRLSELEAMMGDRFDMLELQYLHESPEGQAYQAAEAESERLQTERENVVFARIAEYELQHENVGYPIVVYGSDHEFAEELIVYNQTNNPDAWDRGLIEIKLRESAQ